MRSKKIKTVTGHTALSRELARLGVSDHAMDDDVLKEVKTPQGYPFTPYFYGPTVAFWKGNEGKFYSWPEVKHLKYEIHELLDEEENDRTVSLDNN